MLKEKNKYSKKTGVKLRTKEILSTFLLITLLFLSGFNLLLILNINQSTSIETSELNYIKSLPQSSNGIIEESNRNLLWWVQVSDIHINMEESELLSHFETFCNETLDILDPFCVLDSGDSVDAGPVDENLQRTQNISEYEFFNQTLMNNGLNDSFWLSVPGNHETYNTLNNSPYYDYINEETHYKFIINTTFGQYRYLMIDTTQNVGLVNFFNLWGELTTEDLDQIEELLQEDENVSYNQTIVVGHHPLNNIISEKSSSGKTFQNLLDETNSLVYLTGHLHTEEFYRNDGDLIEIMAPTFKEEYFYRICALDQDLFSFSDEKMEEWPAAVITNPTDSDFYSSKQNLNQMVLSDEIRVLIFDPTPIENTFVKIDGEIIGNLTFVEDNLWILSWDPTQLSSESHILEIFIESGSGSVTKSLTFNLDDFTPTTLKSIGSLVLSFPIREALMITLIICFIMAFSRLILPKLGQKLKKSRFEQYYNTSKMQNSKYSSKSKNSEKMKIAHEKFQSFREKIFFKPWIQAANLSTIDFVLLMIMPLYILIGPVLITDFLPGNIGCLFLWGIVIGDKVVLSITPLLIAGAYLLGFLNLEYFAIRKFQNKLNIFGWIPLIISLLFVGGINYMISTYFGIFAIILNPINLIFISLVLYVFLKIK